MDTIQRRLETTEEATAAALEYGLALPTIEVVDRVDHRLARVGRILEYSEWDLLNGVMSYGVENPMRIHVNSLPKNEKQHEPSVDVDYDRVYSYRSYKQPESVVKISIDTEPTPEDQPDKLINLALWTGIVVTEELAEGKERYYAELRKKDDRRKNFVRPQTVNLIGGAPNLANAVGLISVGWPLSSALTGLALSSTSYLIAKTFLRKNEVPVVDFIANHKKDDIEALATAHPVLSYDATLD